MSEVLGDGASRQRAATDFDTNLVVLAGAGTGKTSLLVERVLNAIGSGIVGLDDLAAITFTEKAAGEMRERLSEGLERLRRLARGELEHDPAEAADRAFAWLRDDRGQSSADIAGRALAAMEQLDRARVSTIHAFCSEVLRDHPVAAGVDPDFAVDSGGNAESQRLEFWERFLSEELGPDAKRPDLWRQALDRFPIGELRDIGFALSSFSVPPELLNADRFPAPQDVLGSETVALESRLRDLLDRETGMTDRTRTWFWEMQEALRAFLADGQHAFAAAVDRTTELAGRLDKNPPGFTKKIEGITSDEFKRALKSARDLARGILALDDAAMRLAVEATAPFARDFREELLRQGIVDFDGLIGLTRNLLRDDAEVRRRIKQRYRMLLIDEFQDTDPAQHEIVLMLGERDDREAETPYATEPGPGRLFVVGDAKQSIYRFRGADYSSYRRAVDHICAHGGERLSLTSNFRSVSGIVEPVNTVFESGAIWQDSDYQPRYEAIAPVRQSDGSRPTTEIWTVDDEEIPLADQRREAEGRVIADAIAAAVDAGECAYRDIHILFRAFGSISQYLRPLRERGIPFVVDGGREFLVRPEVTQLMATLRTLALPGDQPSLLAFLRSPAGAVSDVELTAFAEDGGAWDWREQPDAARHARIADRFALMRSLRDETRWLPADAVIRRVLERTLMLPLGAVAYEGAQRVANLRKLTESAAEVARDGRLSLAEVLDALESGLLEDIETDRPLSDDAAEAVRITSIHRMKGLENAWVILPDLSRQGAGGNRDAYGATVLRTPAGDEVLALNTKSGRNAAAVLHDLEHGRHEDAEEVRVFYVALTRARNRLTTVVGRSRAIPRSVTALASWGYDAKRPPDDGTRLADGDVLHRVVRPGARSRPEAVEAPSDDGAVERWKRATERAIASAEPPLATPSGSASAERPVRPGRGRGGDDALARATGTVVHGVLERLGASLSDERERERRLAALCDDQAIAEGVSADALRDEASQLLASVAASELGRLLSTVEIVGREVPMIVRHEDGRTFRGSIDLLYRDADGVLVVADYKTDRDADELALLERYRHQLTAYASAVEQALKLATPPRAELWLLRTGARICLNTP